MAVLNSLEGAGVTRGGLAWLFYVLGLEMAWPGGSLWRENRAGGEGPCGGREASIPSTDWQGLGRKSTCSWNVQPLLALGPLRVWSR